MESISAIQKQPGPGVTAELGERDGLETWQEAMLQASVGGAHGNVTKNGVEPSADVGELMIEEVTMPVLM